MAYTVAEAEVIVLPNADNFGELAKAQIGPQADAIGRDAGDRIGRQIQERVRVALAELPDAKIGVDVDQTRLDGALADVKAKADVAGTDAGRSMGRKLGDGASQGASGSGGLIAAAIGAGLIAGGPVVAAAAGALFAGIAVVSDKSQVNVHNAAVGMANDVMTEFKQAGQVAAPFLVNAIDQVDAALAGMRGEFTQAFGELQPVIDGVTHGVIALTQNAMPGLLSALHNASPIFAGLDSMLGELGTGLSNLFSIISTHAAAGGIVLSSLGAALRELLTTLGTVAGQGAELGATVLPVLVDALRALNTVVSALAPELPGIALAFASWKIADTLGNGLGALANGLENIGSKAMVWTAAATGSQAAGEAMGTGFGLAADGARGLESAMGPLGLALAAVSLALPLLNRLMSQNDQYEKTVTSSVKDLNSALQQTNGVIDDTVRKQAALAAQKDGLLEYAQKWGVSSSTIVSAILGQNDAYTKVQGSAQAYAGSLRTQANASTNFTQAGEQQVVNLKNQADASDNVFGSLTKLKGGTDSTIANIQQLAAAMGGSSTATNDNSIRLQGLASDASAASSQIDLLKSALDSLTGKAVTMDQAQIAVTQAVQAATAAVKDHTGALTFVNGQLDLSNDKTATAASMLMNLAGAQHQQISVAEQQGQSTAQVTALTDQLRQQFIVTAEQMGANADEAKTLADRYFGIPTDIHTEVALDTNAPQVLTQIANVKAQLDALTSHTYFIPMVTGGSASIHNAMGGIVHAYADGGIEANMAAGVAEIVPPQTYRVIGDRISDDEAYIPINGSARSASILAVAAARMGYGLERGHGGGTSKVDARTYHFAISAPSDPAAIAREIRGAQRDLEFLHG